MKKIMTMVSAIMMVAAANAETKNVAPFNEVNVNVPARVRVIQGNDFGIIVRTKDNIDTNVIKYTVENGILRISTQNIDLFNSDEHKVMITVTTPIDATNLTVGRSMKISVEKDTKVMRDVASL